MYRILPVWLLILLSAFFHSNAQAPANDECTGAIAVTTVPVDVTCAASVAATTVNATQSPVAPSCGSTGLDDDIWYSFTASTSTVIIRYSNVVNAATGSSTSLSMAVYEGGCPGSGSSIFCSLVNTAGSGFRILNGLTPGTTYYLRFWSVGAGVAINFNFCVQHVTAPVNDDCSNATLVNTQPAGSNCSGDVSTSTMGATQSTPNPSCGTGSINDDIWYRFTANTSAISLRIANARNALGTGNAAIGFAIYEADCPSGTATVYCTDNTGFGGGVITIDELTPGATYYLRMWSNGTNNYVHFDFCIEDVIIAPNDECSNAINFTVTPFGAACAASIRASTAGGTQSTPNPSCTGAENNDDVWYRFTATTATVIVRVGNAVINETGAGGTVGFALYEGACPATTTTVICNNILSTLGYQVVTGLTPGAMYYLRFWSTLTGGNTVSFDFCVQEVPAAVNDECADAITVPVEPAGTVCNAGVRASTTGATRSVLAPSCSGNFNDDDVWYSFTAVSSGLRINFSNVQQTTETGTGTPGFALYAGPCPATPTALACSANIGSGGSVLIGGLVPGQQYFLRFFSYATNHFIAFDFCLVDEVLPVNDDCSNALPLTTGTGFCTDPLIGDLSNATPSAGFGAAVCGSTASTTDVWYTATVPATGNLVIQTSSIINHAVDDIVMEAYSGACGNLTLITCDDDSNPITGNGALHPRITLSGRSPGETIYIRVLKKFSLAYSQFSICAWDASTLLPVAAGGNCASGVPVAINAAHGNNRMWVPVLDESGHIMAEVFAHGNNLNNLHASLYVNSSGTIRMAANPYLDRNITLEPDIAAPAKIRIYFKNTEWAALVAADPSISHPGDLRIIKSDASCSPLLAGSTVGIAPDTVVNYGDHYYAEFSINSFSSFFVDGDLDALPLEFLAFRATLQNGSVNLHWTVTEDETIDRFFIQRSTNGHSFVDSRDIPVANRMAVVNGAWQYAYRDEAPDPGINFYRIKMVSVHGKTVYSRIVPVNTVSNNDRSVRYVNPVDDYLVVKLPGAAATADIGLFNGAGVMVKQYRRVALSNGALVLPVQGLPAGIYFVHVTDKQQQYRFKILKR